MKKLSRLLLSAIICLAIIPASIKINPKEVKAMDNINEKNTAASIISSEGAKQPSIYDNMDLSIFDLDCYDNKKYMSYFWDSPIVYNESAMVVRNADGTLDAVKLFYKPEKIISVRSVDLSKKYIENVDYKFENGELTVIEGGNIPVLDYERMYFETNPGDESSGSTVEGNENVQAFPTVDGKYELYQEAGIIYQHQLAVTYYHKDEGDITAPIGKSRELKGFISKLENGESVNIACLGDSISNGSSSSGFFSPKLAPFMPSYFGLVGDYIKAKYSYSKVCLYEDPEYYVEDKADEPIRIKMTNFSVGGKLSDWGVNEVGAVAEKKPDLVIIGFGMNDGSAYVSAQNYYNNIVSIIKTIRTKCPNCAFVVLSTTLPNKNVCWNEGGKSIYGTQESYIPMLEKLDMEESGVVLADMTTVHKQLLQKKNFRDMTGNNVNHPNDFLTRLYAQVIVKTMFD